MNRSDGAARQPLDVERVCAAVAGLRRLRAHRATNPVVRPRLSESQLQRLRALLPPAPDESITQELVDRLNTMNEETTDL